MTDLGIGIIGGGYMARSFAECLARYTQGGRLRAVAGGTRAPATAAEFDVPALGSVDVTREWQQQIPDSWPNGSYRLDAIWLDDPSGNIAANLGYLLFYPALLASLLLLPGSLRSRHDLTD